jgi:hypothetical protein
VIGSPLNPRAGSEGDGYGDGGFVGGIAGGFPAAGHLPHEYPYTIFFMSFWSALDPLGHAAAPVLREHDVAES